MEKPNFGAMMCMTAGLLAPADAFAAIASGAEPELDGAALKMYRGFHAPIADLPDEGFNGFRRFPLSIPLDSYDNGNGAAQTHHYQTLLNWEKPVNFIWGCTDDVFTETWGRTWAERMGASFDPIADAGHFLQNTHGAEVARLIIERG